MQAALFTETVHEPQAKAKRSRARWHWSDSDSVASGGATVLDFFASGTSHVERFGSGASAKWDLLGYMTAREPVGVTATELNTRTNAERIGLLRTYVTNGGRVFVDSGAFGALRSNTELDFEQSVFPVYDALVQQCGNPGGFALVMPDVIGSQYQTRSLQERFKHKILQWLELGVEAIFPMQMPDQDQISEYHRISELTCGHAFTVGIPSNEAAWSPAQTVAFAAAVRPHRLHLLGLAKESLLVQIARDIHQASPSTQLSCDSCQLIAHAGVGRRLTDKCHGRMVDAIDAIRKGLWLTEKALPLPDIGTYVSMVWDEPGFVTPDMAAKMALALGCEGHDWQKQFVDASGSTMREVLGLLDPDEEWLDAKLEAFVDSEMYTPMLKKVLAGPIRAWEVARIACGDDPEWNVIKKRLEI